jgi:dienelactone hydrolase
MTKIVRALHGATTIGAASAPYDTAHFRINYPALWTGSDTERLTGVLPADTELAPWPLAIMLPGINVGSDGYRWIAISLAQAGIATLTYDLVAEVMPGSVALSPGLDISAVMPGEYGRRPSATALAPLLAAVREANTAGPLAGMIDTNRVMLIGHSAGGTVALENASREWVPGLRGVAVYGAHTMPAVMLGHPHGTVLPLPDDVPALVMSGTDDGVIRSSADRYQPTDDHDPVRRTFRESCTHHMSRLVVIDGGTHMVMCHNDDSTTARGFLDDAPTTESLRRDGEVRCLMSGLLIAFAHTVFADSTDASELDRFATHQGVAGWEAHP